MYSKGKREKRPNILESGTILRQGVGNGKEFYSLVFPANEYVIIDIQKDRVKSCIIESILADIICPDLETTSAGIGVKDVIRSAIALLDGVAEGSIR